MREPMDIATRLSQCVVEPCLVEQKVTQTVLSDIVEAAADSIQTLTERIGVSEASVIRFAKAVGYRDVRELKLKLAQTVAVGQRFLDGGADRPPSSADDTLVSISNVLEVNHALVQLEALRAAAIALVAMRMIAAFGMGDGSITMADEMHYRLARLGRPVTTYHDSMLQRVVMATLSPDDVVVVSFVIGHAPEAIDSMAIAYEYGAWIVAIMAIGSPLAVLADVSLPIQAMETDFIFKPSSLRYTMMMMVDLLVTGVALQQVNRSKKSLRRIKYVFDTHRGGGNRQPLGD